MNVAVKTKKLDSINKKKDFILLMREGKRVREMGFFIVYRKNNLAYYRFALFFPKWTGNAVQRNRFKRWTRHFLREKKWTGGLDLLLGFEKREKDFYKMMNYKKICSGFEKLASVLSFES